MSTEAIQLVVTAILAVIAVVAALVAVRAARGRGAATGPQSPPRASAVPDRGGPERDVPEPRDPQPAGPPAATGDTAASPARIVQGRVVVAPTARQIVDVTMGRPLVRLSVVSYGLAHALRPEARDRIVALMRREFRSRRRQRRVAARRAARLTPDAAAIRPPQAGADSWLGELPPVRDATPRREAI